MKKCLSVFLAAVMLFAVCIPAFAVEDIAINMGDDPQKGTADVYTKTTGKDNQNPASYTVIIPADTLIPWRETATEFKYSIQSQLEIGKCLNIAVIGANDEDKLLSTGNKTTASIPYKLSYNNEGGTVKDTLSFNTNTEIVNVERLFYIRIATADWDAVPVTEYQDNLTFKIEIVDIVKANP